MSEPQNQDSANDFQDLVQQALNAPDFAEHRAKCLAFFQEDAAQFESKVPSDRIPQVKRIFKLIKELDPSAFKLLKSMRTAVGLLEEPLRDYILQGLKDVREGLKAGLFTASAAHALIFSKAPTKNTCWNCSKAKSSATQAIYSNCCKIRRYFTGQIALPMPISRCLRLVIPLIGVL